MFVQHARVPRAVLLLLLWWWCFVGGSLLQRVCSNVFLFLLAFYEVEARSFSMYFFGGIIYLVVFWFGVGVSFSFSNKMRASVPTFFVFHTKKRAFSMHAFLASVFVCVFAEKEKGWGGSRFYVGRGGHTRFVHGFYPVLKFCAVRCC